MRSKQTKPMERNSTWKRNKPKLLTVLASRFAAPPASEEKVIAENTEPAKYTALNPETDVKQPRNDSETDAKYFTSSTSNDENVKLNELSLPLQNQILEILDSAANYDAATLQITTKQPYGLGIKTNRSALYRFHRNHQAAKLAAHRDDIGRQAAYLLKNANATDAEFSAAAQPLIKLRLLEASMWTRQIQTPSLR